MLSSYKVFTFVKHSNFINRNKLNVYFLSRKNWLWQNNVSNILNFKNNIFSFTTQLFDFSLHRQVPQIILDDSAKSMKHCKIVITQPRRIGSFKIVSSIFVILRFNSSFFVEKLQKVSLNECAMNEIGTWARFAATKWAWRSEPLAILGFAMSPLDTCSSQLLATKRAYMTSLISFSMKYQYTSHKFKCF
jgi:hypothetical protein